MLIMIDYYCVICSAFFLSMHFLWMYAYAPGACMYILQGPVKHNESEEHDTCRKVFGNKDLEKRGLVKNNFQKKIGSSTS